MKDWKKRLIDQLEPILRSADPRPEISAYHDMPFAIFHYEPEIELELRIEVSLMMTRLEQQSGKTVYKISLAECLSRGLEQENLSPKRLAMAEKRTDVFKMVDTIHKVLSDRQPLDELVASQLPADLDPTKHIAFLVRAGSLFPFYRTSSLLEQLKGKVHIPTVLFYPGKLEGPAGLRFMGKLDAEHNYRPKIF